MAAANLVTARSSAGGRVTFHLLLFLANLALLIAGIIWWFLPPDALALPEVGLQLFDRGLGSAALVGMGLWGMLVCLRPVREGLRRLLPALDPDSNKLTTSRIIMDACIPYEWKQKPVEARMDEEMLAKIKGRWAEYGID